jgi:hypothetical protein
MLGIVARAPRCEESRISYLLPGAGSLESSAMEQAKITSDGLRYKKKVAGTTISDSLGESKMSCFKCGRFFPRKTLISQRLLGKNQLVCASACA